MPSELKIPEVGESITQVQISEWLKSEGDTVKKGDTVAIIDSEKTTFELPAPADGTLTKILHQAGDTVNVGTAVAQFESNGSTATSPPEEKAASRPASSKAASSKIGQESPADMSGRKEKPKENKAGEEGAEEKQKESKAVTEQAAASGDAKEESKDIPKIKSVKSPTEVARLAQPPAKPEASSEREEEVVPMTMLRRTVARRLVEARQTTAMLTTFNEVDMSAVQTLRHEHQEAFEKRYQVKLGLMSFFVKAAVDALKQYPQINAEVRDDSIVYHNYFDIGVAIASERGLVVPMLRNAERLSFAELEKAIGDFAQRAKEGKLKPDELEGGTFTITNGGVFGSLLSTPILNPPQSGILGLHAIQDRPVALSGQVVIRPMMYLALTYDHRIVDGREAVLFLRRVKEVVETPARMLIEV